MPDPKLTITIVVNGQPIVVEANTNAPLHTVIPKALADTQNVGQPPDQWELRDVAGALLDPDKKIGELGLAAGVTLFLNLKAGVGGSYSR